MAQLQFTMAHVMQPSQLATTEQFMVIFLELKEGKTMLINRYEYKVYTLPLTILIDFSNSCGTANGITCVDPKGQAPACKTLMERLMPAWDLKC